MFAGCMQTLIEHVGQCQKRPTPITMHFGSVLSHGSAASSSGTDEAGLCRAKADTLSQHGSQCLTCTLQCSIEILDLVPRSDPRSDPDE